jgi:Tfp pilus assembly protein PilX
LDEATGVMMNPAERYRTLAAHCVRLARHTANSRDKALLLQMAESWVRLAERAETREITDDSDEEK